MILKLGEAGLVHFLISSQVLSELEDVLRRKAPQSLPNLALLLDRCQVSVVNNKDGEVKERCMKFINHSRDALVMADAISGNCDYFVILDREHFINNSALVENLSFPMGTPGDFISWLRGQITANLMD